MKHTTEKPPFNKKHQAKIEHRIKSLIIDKIYADIESYTVLDEYTVTKDETGHIFNDCPLVKTAITFKDKSVIESCMVLEYGYGYSFMTSRHGEDEYGDYLVCIETDNLKYRKYGNNEDIVRAINFFTNIEIKTRSHESDH